eukprot:289017-Ditylum_brightwellii.AAC.1
MATMTFKTVTKATKRFGDKRVTNWADDSLTDLGGDIEMEEDDEDYDSMQPPNHDDGTIIIQELAQ